MGLSMDGAMTKAPLGGKKTGPNPTDRGKDGVKRSLLTEGYGVPIGLAVDGANGHDMKLVRPTLESIVVERPQPTHDQPQGMCLDKGYDECQFQVSGVCSLARERAQATSSDTLIESAASSSVRLAHGTTHKRSGKARIGVTAT